MNISAINPGLQCAFTHIYAFLTHFKHMDVKVGYEGSSPKFLPGPPGAG